MAEDTIDIEDLRKRVHNLAVGVTEGLGHIKTNCASAALVQQAVVSAGRTVLLFRSACNVKSKDEFHQKLPTVIEVSEETVHWLSLLIEVNLIPKEKMLPILGLAKETAAALLAARVSRSYRSKRSSR